MRWPTLWHSSPRSPRRNTPCRAAWRRLRRPRPQRWRRRWSTACRRSTAIPGRPIGASATIAARLLPSWPSCAKPASAEAARRMVASADDGLLDRWATDLLAAESPAEPPDRRCSSGPRSRCTSPASHRPSMPTRSSRSAMAPVPAAVRPRSPAPWSAGRARMARASCSARCAARPGTTSASNAPPAATPRASPITASRARTTSSRPRPARPAALISRSSSSTRPRPRSRYADDLATLGLDLKLREAGWRRIGANLLLSEY